MPTLVESFTPQIIKENTITRLKEIDPGNGYNSRPNVHDRFVWFDTLEEGQMPAIIPQWADMDNEVALATFGTTPGEEQFGTIKANWTLFLFLVARDQEDVEKVILGMEADVMAAIWRDPEMDESGALFFNWEGTRHLWNWKDDDPTKGLAIMAWQTQFELDEGENP